MCAYSKDLPLVFLLQVFIFRTPYLAISKADSDSLRKDVFGSWGWRCIIVNLVPPGLQCFTTGLVSATKKRNWPRVGLRMFDFRRPFKRLASFHSLRSSIRTRDLKNTWAMVNVSYRANTHSTFHESAWIYKSDSKFVRHRLNNTYSLRLVNRCFPSRQIFLFSVPLSSYITAMKMVSEYIDINFEWSLPTKDDRRHVVVCKYTINQHHLLLSFPYDVYKCTVKYARCK